MILHPPENGMSYWTFKAPDFEPYDENISPKKPWMGKLGIDTLGICRLYPFDEKTDITDTNKYAIVTERDLFHSYEEARSSFIKAGLRWLAKKHVELIEYTHYVMEP